jgi:hypothetical protein
MLGPWKNLEVGQRLTYENRYRLRAVHENHVTGETFFQIFSGSYRFMSRCENNYQEVDIKESVVWHIYQIGFVFIDHRSWFGIYSHT